MKILFRISFLVFATILVCDQATAGFFSRLFRSNQELPPTTYEHNSKKILQDFIQPIKKFLHQCEPNLSEIKNFPQIKHKNITNIIFHNKNTDIRIYYQSIKIHENHVDYPTSKLRIFSVKPAQFNFLPVATTSVDISVKILITRHEEQVASGDFYLTLLKPYLLERISSPNDAIEGMFMSLEHEDIQFNMKIAKDYANIIFATLDDFIRVLKRYLYVDTTNFYINEECFFLTHFLINEPYKVDILNISFVRSNLTSIDQDTAKQMDRGFVTIEGIPKFTQIYYERDYPGPNQSNMVVQINLTIGPLNGTGKWIQDNLNISNQCSGFNFTIDELDLNCTFTKLPGSEFYFYDTVLSVGQIKIENNDGFQCQHENNFVNVVLPKLNQLISEFLANSTGNLQISQNRTKIEFKNVF